MASITQLLEALNTKAAAVSTAALATELGASSEATLKQLKREREKGTVDGSSEEGWLITDDGKKALEKGIHPTMIEEGVTPRQRFEAIGQRIGINKDRITLAADIVWSGDYNDIKWVWEALGQADVADDLRSVWVNAWRAKLHKAIPVELLVELTGAAKAESETSMARAKGPDRDFIIVDDEPARVGSGLGDYSLQDAKDILAIRALKSRFGGAAQAGSGQPAAIEKVSDLLTALGPYIKAPEGTSIVQLLLTQLSDLQKEMRSGLKPPESSQEIQALSKQIDNYREQLHNEQLTRIQDQNQAQVKELTDSLKRLEQRIAAATEGKQAESKIGLMGKGLEAVVSELKGVRADIKPLAQSFIERGARPGEKTAVEKAAFATGLDKGIETAHEAKELENELFFGKGS